MARRFDWPETEGLVAFINKVGTVTEAAERLGVAQSTLSAHLRREGVSQEEYVVPQGLNPDALEEIRALIDND